MANFWQTLPRPFLAFAPMDDVTDFVFREIVASYSKPDVFFTEFTSVDGLFSAGRANVIRKFKYSEAQRPIVAQIWGKNPEYFYKAAQLIKEFNFDGVDINMGCPDRTIMRNGSGAGLVANYPLAREIVESVRAGCGDLALSVKTRLGRDSVIVDEWIGFLLGLGLDAIIIHGRTAKQMSKVPADWEQIGKAVKMRDETAPGTVIVGNGDIGSYREACLMQKNYEVDGVMIGRGIFMNPWVFEKSAVPRVHTRSEYTRILVNHLKLNHKTWGESRNYEIMKKYFKMYLRDFDGASQLRLRLMETKNYLEALQIIKDFDASFLGK